MPPAIRLTLVLVLLTAFGAPLTNSAAQTAMPIAGVYAAEGTNADGSAYRALVIIRAYEDAFRLEWLFPSRQAVVGLGILNGDVLAVSYFGATPGIVVYAVDDDRLVGRWTIVGAGGRLLTETLIRIPHHDIPPDPAPEPAADPGPGPAVML